MTLQLKEIMYNKAIFFLILLLSSVFINIPNSVAQQSTTITPILSLLLPGQLTGLFIDSRVSGLRYKTSSGIAGRTSNSGEFKYKPNDSIEFFIGNFPLGSVVTGRLISVIELDNFSQVSMLLQALDNDQNPNNGIHINIGDDTALRGLKFSLQEVDPDDESFKEDFKRVTGKEFQIIDFNAIQHSYSSVRIEALKENDYTGIYQYYTGKININDAYNKDRLEKDVKSRIRLYFWQHLTGPFYELCGKNIWNETVETLDSHETHKRGIEYTAKSLSVINAVSKNPNDLVKGFNDGAMDIGLDEAIDLTISGALPDNGLVTIVNFT